MASFNSVFVSFAAILVCFHALLEVTEAGVIKKVTEKYFRNYTVVIFFVGSRAPTTS